MILRRFHGLAVLTTMLIATIALADEDKKDKDKKKDKAKAAELKKLQGDWKAAEGFEKDLTMTIKGSNFTLQDGQRSIKGKFKIDHKKSPMHMDLTITGGTDTDEVEKYKGKTSKAIFKVEGDKFQWCANEPGRDERPTKLERGQALYIVFERKKE